MLAIPWILAALVAADAAPPGPNRSTRDPATDARDEATRWLGVVVTGEPDVPSIQRAAEARAAPSREETDGWRRRARLAGVLPRLVAEYRHDERSLRASGVSSGEALDYVRLMPGDTVMVRLAWDLDTLIFGRSELAAVQAAQAAGTRRSEAVERATKLFFERMRLRLLLVAKPPETSADRARAEVELASVTAQLHALTGLYREELR